MVKDVKPVSFNWSKASPYYEIAGEKVAYKAGGDKQYLPVMGGLEMKPNTGKYFYEIYVNCDNMRIGLCTASANLEGEMGKIPDVYSLNLQTGACEVNGQELKKLWRLVVPVSGGIFGFVYDSDAGTLQLYFNEEFHGTVFNEKFDLKGKSVFPCVGIAGIEANNRNIGVGMKAAVVNKEPVPYRTFI